MTPGRPFVQWKCGWCGRYLDDEMLWCGHASEDGKHWENGCETDLREEKEHPPYLSSESRTEGCFAILLEEQI